MTHAVQARVKTVVDPTPEKLKSACASVRKRAKV